MRPSCCRFRYHGVFTLPVAIGAIAFHNKAAVYDLLFRTAAETLITIAADPKHLGARIGLTAVLHTWGSALTHHPHVHVIVPGGGLSLDGERWIACRPGFFLPVRVTRRNQLVMTAAPIRTLIDNRQPTTSFAAEFSVAPKPIAAANLASLRFAQPAFNAGPQVTSAGAALGPRAKTLLRPSVAAPPIPNSP